MPDVLMSRNLHSSWLQFASSLQFADPTCVQVEDFYFSSAAGRARIVLGNRRWGENGYVASGRQQGRPVQRTPNNKVCNHHTAHCPVCCMPLYGSSQADLSNRHYIYTL